MNRGIRSDAARSGYPHFHRRLPVKPLSGIAIPVSVDATNRWHGHYGTTGSLGRTCLLRWWLGLPWVSTTMIDVPIWAVLSYEQPVVVPSVPVAPSFLGMCRLPCTSVRPSGKSSLCLRWEKRSFFKSGRVENENPALVLSLVRRHSNFRRVKGQAVCKRSREGRS